MIIFLYPTVSDRVMVSSLLHHILPSPMSRLLYCGPLYVLTTGIASFLWCEMMNVTGFLGEVGFLTVVLI